MSSCHEAGCRDQEEELEEDEDVDDDAGEAGREVGQQLRLGDDFTRAAGVQAGAWDEDELRLRIAPPKSAGLRRRLGITRRVFDERLIQQQRDAAAAGKGSSKSRSRSRKRRGRQDELETASAMAVIEQLTRELRESSAQSVVCLSL